MSRPFTILGLDHIVLRVDDVDAMIAFYCDLLGCVVERRLDDLGLIQLRAGASLIDLVPVASKLGQTGGAPPGQEGRNLEHFCLRIDGFDAETLAAYLGSHGLRAGEVARRYGADGFGPSIYITDPQGNTVELKGDPTGNMG